ncbi:hypothetical protein HELRODRAFT_162059 [Helobdella robusta]|uniref:FYVE-type zinc finger domain-containing protein n=1 Tax=Helobdella robusta TaxID=6412 RepID=T1ES75_HELRO|nr:hypothetical protein HELRODRAFT_162059 [Helobdella robusta]ESN98622.1 hypothetical protein HELRODRAFT_162059 [Helobdella robusta]
MKTVRLTGSSYLTLGTKQQGSVFAIARWSNNLPRTNIDHLNKEEIDALKKVFSKMEEFEHEESERIRQLEEKVRKYEEMVKSETANRGNALKQNDIRLCRLCFVNRFPDGIGRVCVSCHRRVCNDCGSLSKSKSSLAATTSVSSFNKTQKVLEIIKNYAFQILLMSR